MSGVATLCVLALCVVRSAGAALPGVVEQQTLRSAQPLSGSDKDMCGDYVCTDGESAESCDKDCDPFRVTWRGCVGMLEPPSAGCLELLPSAATLRLEDLEEEKRRSCGTYMAWYRKHGGTPSKECQPPSSVDVPEGVLLPDSGGVVFPPRPDNATWEVDSVWRFASKDYRMSLCVECKTHPTEERVYSGQEAALVLLGSGLALYNPASALIDGGAARQRAKAVERRPGAPNIFVIVLDGASVCQTRMGAPRLAELMQGRGQGLEGLGIFPMSNFHRLTEMTTYEHMTMALSGVRQVLHKHGISSKLGMSLNVAELGTRFISRFLQEQGYLTATVGHMIGSRPYPKKWFAAHFDAVIPARTTMRAHETCLGGVSEPLVHLRWVDQLAAAVEADAPLFGLMHNFHQHDVPSDARLFDSLVDELPAILRRSNTVVAVLGDHGQGEMRDWPMLSFMASDSTWEGLSARTGRDVPAALRSNADRLVGHYDVYETLRELGEAQPGERFRTPVSKHAERFLPWEGTKARSMLAAVGDRTFLEVGVAPYILLNARMRPAPQMVDEASFVAAVSALVGEMNAAVDGMMAQDKKLRCPKLELEAVHAARRSELDGVAAFQVQFTISPGRFRFEAFLLQRPGEEGTYSYIHFPTRIGDSVAFSPLPLSKYAINHKCAGAASRARLCMCGVKTTKAPPPQRRLRESALWWANENFEQ